MKKCLPVFSLISLLVGTAFLGFSFVVVHDGYIGYYIPSAECGPACEVQIYDPGMHMSLPWSKGTFNILDVRDRNITIGPVLNTTCIAEFEVSDKSAYIRAVMLYSNSAGNLDRAIITDVRSLPENSTSYAKYGLELARLYYV